MQVASQFSTTELGEYNAIFVRLAGEAGTSGRVPVATMVKALVEMGIRPETADEAIEGLDIDKSGDIGYTEFVAGCICMLDQRLDDKLQQAFQSFDLDRDGFLSRQDLEQLLQSEAFQTSGLSRDHVAISEMIDELDTDRNGVIDFQEFRAYFTPALTKAEFQDAETGDHVAYIFSGKGLEYWKNGKFKRCVHEFSYHRATGQLEDVKGGFSRALAWTGKRHVLPEEDRDDILAKLKYLCECAHVPGIESLTLSKSAMSCRTM